MNSENRNLLEKEPVLTDNETSKNLMKLQQLTDLGLVLFDSDLEPETLTLNLLNQDTVSLISAPGSSKEHQSHVDFSTLNDYVSDGMMDSLSPEREQIEVIKVLPATNDLFIEPSKAPRSTVTAKSLFSDNAVPAKSTDDSVTDYEILTEKLDINSENSKKGLSKVVFDTFYQKLDEETCKKIKLRSFKIPNSKVRLIANSNNTTNNIFKSVSNKINENENTKNSEITKNYVDSSELENKINDTLLDMLQSKIIGKNANSTSYLRNITKPPERVNEKENSKFITIFPSKPVNKVINLMLKGKTCRSKQPLTESELRIVTRILNQESILQNEESLYKNVYYDTESDSNIRYEVKHDVAPEDKNIPNDINLIKNKKGRPKSSQANEESSRDSSKTDEKYVLKSVARTRCGRVSRPPRHVVRDYKRLKHLTTRGSDAEDENENNGGYADYQALDESNKQAIINEKEKEVENLYGPLEPNKRQFSSLSLCPTCGKVYLGYRRMAIHFQKYPDHKNEELLKRLLDTKKKPLDDTLLSDSSEINTNENILISDSNSVRSNGSLKKKRKLCRRLRMPGAKNPAALKEILSVYGVEEIMKYTAPIIAGVLSSWEYLLIRSKKLKSNETLVAVLLKEIAGVLKQIRSLSQYLLKPYDENKENISNKFTIEEEDILQHVLGIMPGTYATIDDEDWTNEFFHFNSCFKNEKALVNNVKPEKMADVNQAESIKFPKSVHKAIAAKSCSTPVMATTDTFYKLQNRIGFSTLDFSPQNIEDELGLSTNETLSTMSNMNVNGIDSTDEISYDAGLDKSSNLLKNVSTIKLGTDNFAQAPSLDSSLPRQQTTTEQKLLSDTPKLNDYVADFNKSYCTSNSLGFDTFDNTGVDMMNDFPINLPLLSDNSSDGKDCLQLLRTSSAEDLLNSLKQIDNSNESVIVGLGDAISSNLPLSSNSNLESTFNGTVNQTATPCMLDFESISSNFHCNDN